MKRLTPHYSFFFFNDTATTEIYTLSLHDALPISGPCSAISFLFAVTTDLPAAKDFRTQSPAGSRPPASSITDRKSTRLNSSHTVISYAVFCLKKKTRTHNGTLSK